MADGLCRSDQKLLEFVNMATIIWVAVALVAMGMYLRRVYSKFSTLGVNHLPPIPFFGDMFRPFFRLENLAHTLVRIKTAFPEDKVVGMYEMMKPMYVVQDVDIIKKVTVKDFDHFVDRRSFASESDPSFGRGLLNLRGEEWKEMRSTLSPAFTSSKIRLMVPFMVDVGEDMIKVLNKRIKDSRSQHIDVNLKDITSRYANDVIATCAFGLKVESQSADSQFYLKAKDITTFGFFRVLKVFFYWWFPFIANALKMPITAPETTNFFTEVVLGTMVEREKKNIVRHDMINILNEIKRGKLTEEKETPTDSSAGFATVEESSIGRKVQHKEWTDTDLVAQAILFLAAGFDTVSTAMSFIIYELAVNPDVQDKLVQEINDNDQKNNGKFDFNSIQRMKYMDMVVSEGLRKYPPAAAMDRLCVKDYNIGRVNKSSTKDLIIRKGDILELPIWTFHYDPQLFPNPDKFDPERFSEENSHNIKPFSYMPFGAGPRNCIGSRFALCEVKVMLYILLRNIKVTPSEKTKIPLKLENGIIMGIDGGGWVRFEVRQ